MPRQSLVLPIARMVLDVHENVERGHQIVSDYGDSSSKPPKHAGIVVYYAAQSVDILH